MSKPLTLGIVIGLALMVGGGVAASRKQESKGQTEFQAELEGATAVKGTVLSEKQRIHSKLFNGFRQNEERISDLIAPYKGTKIVYGISVSYRMAQASANTESSESYFERLTQESDAVVLGKATERISQITDDGNFVFTDYAVAIKEILKNNANAPLDSGTTITVTSPGGKVLIDDVIVKTSSNAFGSLPINNHYLVLFLTSIKETGDYRLTRYNEGFELDGAAVHPIASVFPSGLLKDGDAFLKTVRAASNK